MGIVQVISPVLTEEASPDHPPRTLADIRDILLRAPDADSPQVKLQLSAINTVSRACGCAPDDLPVDPARLRRHLSTISPAMAGLTKGSWDSVRSRILKALLRAEVDVMPSRRTHPLSPDWAPLYHSLPRDSTQKSLGRLISYCSDHGISPQDVSDEVIERFAFDLKTSSLRGRPTAIVRGAVRGWNPAIDHVPGWPQHRLTLAEIGRATC